jgi:transposase InsO family protein
LRWLDERCSAGAKVSPDRDQLTLAGDRAVPLHDATRTPPVSALNIWLRSSMLVPSLRGYAIGRSMDARLAVAAFKAAIGARDPPRGCVHHSDRGSQYASDDYRAALQKHGLTGSMGRRGNPYDNAKAKTFMKTLKVEAVYLMAYETFEDVIADLPCFIDEVTTAADSTTRKAI